MRAERLQLLLSLPHLRRRGIIGWQNMQSRSKCDDEFLLAKGVVRPPQALIHSVQPGDCDRTFRPWAETGELIPPTW